MAERIYVATKPHHRDALGEGVRQRIVNDLGIGTIRSVRIAKVYSFNGTFTDQELIALAQGPFTDPIIEDFTVNQTIINNFTWMIEVGFKPGVTDNVGRTASEAVKICLKRKLNPDFSAHVANQYFIEGELSRKHIERIAGELLANELIQSSAIYSQDEWRNRHTQKFEAPRVKNESDITPWLPINLNLTDAELVRLSKDSMLALSLEEMQVIRDYYAKDEVQSARSRIGLPAMPTNVELEILAQTWSEHCKHKIFNAQITYVEDNRNPQSISSLFKVYIQRATGEIRKAQADKDICLSVFKDNAGVIRFNNDWALVFKVETHNSPSALDPYGGALTGIVGVNRDPFGTGLGCRLIANTDVFCFADPFYDKQIPPRILHPKRVFEGVREGVEHGGNKSGIPTVNGCLVFDDRFLGKPLVYCGTLGIMPMEINGRKGYEKKALIGDHIIMTGGRIGKDGIHGATFSSEPLHEGSPATAVQIGDPITQKRMTDFLLAARDNNLYNSITDNGAGGLSSSVGEMAEDTNGAVVHLDRAPLKYHGLEPWEIFLSEAQERMTVAVPPDKIDTFMALADEWSVEATDLGEFTGSGNLELRYNNEIIAQLAMDFLHDGLPQMHLAAKWTEPPEIELAPVPDDSIPQDIINLMKRLNICSKEYVVRQYDHEVQAGSVVKPLCGVQHDGPSDAAVVRPLLDSFEGIVVSNGIVPRYSDIDTYAMATAAVDEAVRNAVCSGANPHHIAALDNFCWCDPVQSPENPDGEYKLAQLVRANQALYDMCVHYSMPLISGKDSMKNDYRIGATKISIPPTLLVSVVAKIDDVRQAVTIDLKVPGNELFVAGITYRELGGSEYALMKGLRTNSVPRVKRPKRSFALYTNLHSLIQQGIIKSCHDLSDGGFGTAVTEMCCAGELGAEIDVATIPQSGCLSTAEILFSESQSRILFEATPDAHDRILCAFADLPVACIGTVTKGDLVVFKDAEGSQTASVSRIEAKSAWKSTLTF
ncbi:MAG: phosphoribosylformylglycinamidine synthase [Chitinivibrionales bacterium]|nr:phosphoribosylformylglycinamidine synthase [Chitinivibrionales bacterium]